MFLILRGDSSLILSPYFSNDRKGYNLNTKSAVKVGKSYTLNAPRPPSEHLTEPDR
jgi:hypothetical protein